MAKSDKKPLAGAVPSSKHSNTDRLYRDGSGLVSILESTEAEQLGVLPHECMRVKDAMSRSVTIVTPLTEIGEAVRLMKSLGVGAVIVCHDSMLVGTLSTEILLWRTRPRQNPFTRS